MRVINLLLHLFTAALMLPDLFFIGISFLWGIQYLKGLETVIVPIVVLLFCTAFFFATAGAVMQCVKYKKQSPGVYMVREMIMHGLPVVCFVIMIVYELVITLHGRGGVYGFTLFYEQGTLSIIDLTGIGVGVIGMILTSIGTKIRKSRLAKQTQ